MGIGANAKQVDMAKESLIRALAIDIVAHMLKVDNKLAVDTGFTLHMGKVMVLDTGRGEMRVMDI